MNQSAWAGPFTFSTACNPVTVFPIQEGFNTMVPPTCWSETIVTTSSTPPDWYFATSGFNPINAPYEGNGMAAFNSYNCTNGAQSRLESPYYDFTGITSPILTYQMYHDNTFASSTTEGIQIQATTNGTTWTNLGSFNVRYRTTNGWDDVTLDLSAYTGQTVKVGFLGVSQFGNNMYIDDVYIGNIPTCFPPSIIEISNITATSATAAWVSANGNNAWNYELGLSGFTPGTGTSVFSGNTTDTTHIFNALSNSLTYAFYIQADCGANGLSTWEGPYTFTTLCLPVTTLPLAENFDHSGNLPACWTANHNAASGTYVNWEMVLNDPNGAPSGYGGSGYFASLDCFNGMVDGNSYNLTTVPIFIPGPFYKLSYYAWISSGYSLATPITVRVSSDNGNTWTALYSHDMSIVDTWTQNTILLSAYSQQNILIRFEGYSDWGFGANNLGIDQVEIYADKFIEYSSFGFQESTANDGTIQDTIVLQLSGETFAVTGTLTEGTHYTTTNIPSGLHAQIEVISADSARFTLTGTALNHDNAFDINNIGLEFINVAFTGNSASTITFYKVDTIAINFIDFLVINEVDADQAGSDVREFIELYDGGTGNYSLDGYCIVLYNGNTDVVYNAWGLSGHSTNANGYFVMGTTAVASATLNFPGNTIQNGEDAIALYEGSVASFPAGTAIHKNGLIDAVIYDNGQADNPALLYLVEPGEPQIDENEYGMGTVYSFQRIPNGSGGMQHSFTFAVAPPTPGSENTPAPMLSWSTDTFRESLTNDGSIENFITLTLHNDLVVPTGILQQTIHYTSLNVPAGLNFQLTAINDTTIKVQLTGQAINHLPIDDVANIELHFTNAVFDTHTSTMIVYANRSDLKINFDDPVETQINSSTNFQFYPNPANESLTIILPYKTSGETLRILDISGREIMNQQITDSKTQINTGSLAPGVYILKIRSGQGVFIKSEN
ncbi:MAG: hypothetical protein CVU05_12480 [Bacteroidetes bacterium HGW-Bacteroidetes-21]|nr:MAG: hypothetical protein CVU05_12480 [Bacteroidetes bacterium HGW-Bacteroidetes-21]